MTKRKRNIPLFEGDLVNQALKQSFIKLNPRTMLHNPVMFTVEIGTVVMAIVTANILFTHDKSQGTLLYNLIINSLLMANPRPVLVFSFSVLGTL